MSLLSADRHHGLLTAGLLLLLSCLNFLGIEIMVTDCCCICCLPMENVTAVSWWKMSLLSAKRKMSLLSADGQHGLLTTTGGCCSLVGQTFSLTKRCIGPSRGTSNAKCWVIAKQKTKPNQAIKKVLILKSSYFRFLQRGFTGHSAWLWDSLRSKKGRSLGFTKLFGHFQTDHNYDVGGWSIGKHADYKQTQIHNIKPVSPSLLKFRPEAAWKCHTCNLVVSMRRSHLLANVISRLKRKSVTFFRIFKRKICGMKSEPHNKKCKTFEVCWSLWEISKRKSKKGLFKVTKRR